MVTILRGQRSARAVLHVEVVIEPETELAPNQYQNTVGEIARG